jgi:hypothetical protein
MAATHSLPSTLPEGLRYYLFRGSFMVPLVPVEQLQLQLQGVLTHMTHHNKSDEN